MAVVWRQAAPGLHAGSTAREFLAAEPVVREAFVARMCVNDGCLAPVDRRCGWVPAEPSGTTQILGRCVEMAASAVAPGTPLLTLSRYCGTIFAERAASPEATPEACVAAGGTWGGKTDPNLPGQD